MGPDERCVRTGEEGLEDPLSLIVWMMAGRAKRTVK
jgi:hypothetical protein